jgi:Trypsin-like peptidase domain/CHAT domain
VSADQALLDLLASSTVRIDVAGSVSGTGFVVAPGQVLTCHHVLAPALKRPEGLDLVTVTDPRKPGSAQRPLDQVVLNPDNDLALLRVPSAQEMPVVLLGDGVQVDDGAYLYGYTPDKPLGTPETLIVGGVEGGPPRLIKFKGGNVVRGLSGAPVLNRRTGMVVGIMRRSRDVTAELGGLATPADVLSTVFDRLPKDNREAHQKDSRWRRAMSPDQLAFYRRLDAGPDAPAQELLVDVGQDEDRWTVSITCPSVDESWSSAVRVDLNVLRPDVAKLFRMLKATGRLTPMQQSHVVGQALVKALWSDDVQQRLRELLLDGRTILHFSLRFRNNVDEDLQYLPWEAMFLPPTSRSAGDAIRFSAHPAATFTRTVDIDEARLPLPEETLKVLVFRSPGEPDDVRLPNTAKDVVAMAAASACQVSEVPSDAGDHATAIGLMSALKLGEPTVLHYVGFGRYYEGHDQIELDGHPEERHEWNTADDFAALLAENPPRLVILQPSKASDSEVPVDFTVIAPALLDVGVLAVLAFPLPVDAEAANTFFNEFYQQIGAGNSVRTAVQRGRNRLETGRRPWAFPALIARSPGDLRLTSASSSRAFPVKSSS